MHRLYQSEAGATGGCMIRPNKYNYDDFIDLDKNKQYLIYQNNKYPLKFIQSTKQNYTSSIGIAPHQNTKNIEHWAAGRHIINLVFVSSYPDFKFAYLLFNGKEYRFKDQSPMISDH